MTRRGPGTGRPDSQGRQGPAGRRPGDPRAGAGPNPVIPPGRTSGPGPRMPRDGDHRQEPRLPSNARLPGGQGARRPGPGTRPPGGPRRPPRRPPRWLTVRRGEPGRRVGITFLSIAIVLTLFAGRLVQIQVLQSGYYKAAANAEKLTTITLPALRGKILRRERADPGDDHREVHDQRGPDADTRREAAHGRAAAGWPARHHRRAAALPAPPPDVAQVRGARQGRVEPRTR